MGCRIRAHLIWFLFHYETVSNSLANTISNVICKTKPSHTIHYTLKMSFSVSNSHHTAKEHVHKSLVFGLIGMSSHAHYSFPITLLCWHMSHTHLATWLRSLMFIIIIIIDHFPSSFYVNKTINELFLTNETLDFINSLLQWM